jgi:hypothetical protein
MEKLRFTPSQQTAADPDEPVLSDQDLRHAAKEGEAAQR